MSLKVKDMPPKLTLRFLGPFYLSSSPLGPINFYYNSTSMTQRLVSIKVKRKLKFNTFQWYIRNSDQKFDGLQMPERATLYNLSCWAQLTYCCCCCWDLRRSCVWAGLLAWPPPPPLSASRSSSVNSEPPANQMSWAGGKVGLFEREAMSYFIFFWIEFSQFLIFFWKKLKKKTLFIQTLSSRFLKGEF